VGYALTLYRTGPASDVRTNVAAINYVSRVVIYALAAAVLVSVPTRTDASVIRVLFVLLLVWPHVAYWRGRRKIAGATAETANYYVDCLLGGVLITLLGFRLWVATAVLTIIMMNTLLYGGVALGARAVAVLLFATLATGWAVRPELHLETEPIGIGLSAAAILGCAAFVGHLAHRLIIRQRDARIALRNEERRSLELLENVFPRSVVPRLRAGENPIADQFADVTVVFADIVGYTPLAESLGPKRTVTLLNDLYRMFDLSAARLGVEKIETAGDGYLAVGGAPESLDDHPRAVATFALAMLEASRAVLISDSEPIQVRVGIHTGPVFAGVIGQHRFHYAVFGETVNVASRIQSQSRPGQVLVSEVTAKRLQGSHRVEEHGTVDLKGHGPMRTFWLQPSR